MDGKPLTTLVDVRDARFGYMGRPVVQVDELRLHPGRSLGIFGPNGSGKTTLVRGITGLLPPIAGRVVRQSNDRPGPRFGYLPQHRAMESHWPMTGLDAACFATSARRPLGWLADTGGVVRMMEMLGVADLAYRPFARLSGGQQQRILLAGAMAARPDVLVLDEPTDGLDVRSRDALLALLRQFTSEGLCAVVISHEVEDLLYVCDTIAWLHAAGDPDQPSRVELTSPTELAARMVKKRRAP